MIRTRTAGLQRWVVTAMICAFWATFDVSAQSGSPGSRIAHKLERAGVIDGYFPEVVFEVASALARAANGQWGGVQVNQAHREGWLNIYMIDARRLPQQEDLLDEEGVPNFNADNLRGGAVANSASGTIFLNTAMWKRLTAATLMKQAQVQPDITRALASVDSMGLDAARRYWDPATLLADNQTNQRTGWLMRGALAFVLAHEMGHLRIGSTLADEPDMLRLRALTRREMDERRACPELVEKESRQRQKLEMDADLAGVALLGAQCRIGVDGPSRHAIFMLGTSWYFLASISDKLIDMGRNTDSAVIAQALLTKLGPQLYADAIAAHASETRYGAVAHFFPLSHPPDTARMHAIEGALRATPCGSGGLDSGGAQLLETFRLQVCRNLIGRESTR